MSDSEILAVIALAGSGLTMLYQAAMAINQRHRDRDLLDHNVKFALLEQTVTVNKERADNLEKSHEECLENHAVTEAKLEKCEEGHASNDKRLSALEAIITPQQTPKPPGI